MKKVGIVTLYGEYNFGNRVQNYAVQEILKKYKLDVETIKYLGENDDVARSETKKDQIRLNHFREFNKKIKFGDEILYKEKEVSDTLKNRYEYIVMGSDQIWNYTFDTIFSDKALGSFMPKNKKISLSASIGVNQPPEKNTEMYDMFKTCIEDIKSISVREDAGKKIIEEMTGRKDVEVLLDPTMIIETEKWEEVMKKPVNLSNKKFILKSFLGNDNNGILKEIEEYAEKNDYEIIDISNSDSEFFDIGPSEFLYLEKNAELVITDSFHACVFAILFNTQFGVIKRNDSKLKDMYSRIETLLNTFDIPKRVLIDR